MYGVDDKGVLKMGCDWQAVLADGVRAQKKISEHQLASLQAYVALLVSWNKVHNLTGFDSQEEMVRQLVLPSIALSSALGAFACVLDLGTGAGVPGMVLAMVHPGQRWVLVEKSTKKALFLRHAVQRLGLDNVEVISQDFKTVAVDERVDAVVSRGSAKLGVQLSLTEKWRKHGVPLYSVQTEKSLQEQAQWLNGQACERQPLNGSDGLVLVKIS